MIVHPYLEQLRENIRHRNDGIAERRVRWVQTKRYYETELLRELSYVIELGRSILHIKCGVGGVLAGLWPSEGLGIDDSPAQIAAARGLNQGLAFSEETT